MVNLEYGNGEDVIFLQQNRYHPPIPFQCPVPSSPPQITPIPILVLGVNLLSREGNSQTGEWMLPERSRQLTTNRFHLDRIQP